MPTLEQLAEIRKKSKGACHQLDYKQLLRDRRSHEDFVSCLVNDIVLFNERRKQGLDPASDPLNQRLWETCQKMYGDLSVGEVQVLIEALKSD